MTTITKPGFYDLPASAYHADPCPEPSLSNSIAKILLDQSPLHAKFAHPRLNPDREEIEITRAMDMGTALHKLLLGKGADISEIKFADYKKEAAKVARDYERTSGRIPVLTADFYAINECAASALTQMRQREDCAEFFDPGTSEVVMAWKEGDIWCRAMVDRLPSAPRSPIFDVKGTMLSANPAQWDRRMVRAYRTQDRFYDRGNKALTGTVRQPMRFVVVEMKKPFALSVMTPAPSLQHVAADDVRRAISIWDTCLKSGEWPGYPHMAHIEAPNWLLREQEDQALRDEALEFAQ